MTPCPQVASVFGTRILAAPESEASCELRTIACRRARGGTPYIGSSAGSNIAGPNILTTNDWNVDGWTRLDALGIVPFNVNPHY